MIKLERCKNSDRNFIDLIVHLDKELAIRDGEDHTFYDQFNKLDNIKHCVVAYENNVPVACGAVKYYDEETFEVKRMFTLPKYRGKGIAGKVLSELEKWAKELLVKRCVLETGINQPEAIALYQRLGYSRIANYGQYEGITSSLCFQKII